MKPESQKSVNFDAMHEITPTSTAPLMLILLPTWVSLFFILGYIFKLGQQNITVCSDCFGSFSILGNLGFEFFDLDQRDQNDLMPQPSGQ